MKNCLLLLLLFCVWLMMLATSLDELVETSGESARAARYMFCLLLSAKVFFPPAAIGLYFAYQTQNNNWFYYTLVIVGLGICYAAFEDLLRPLGITAGFAFFPIVASMLSVAIAFGATLVGMMGTSQHAFTRIFGGLAAILGLFCFNQMETAVTIYPALISIGLITTAILGSEQYA